MDIQPIIAATIGGGLSYYYFNIYKQTNLVTDSSEYQQQPSVRTPVTKSGDLERINNAPFSQ